MGGKYENKCALQDCHRIDILTNELKKKVSWKVLNAYVGIVLILTGFYSGFFASYVSRKTHDVENNTITVSVLVERTLNLDKKLDDIKLTLKEVLKEARK